MSALALQRMRNILDGRPVGPITEAEAEANEIHRRERAEFDRQWNAEREAGERISRIVRAGIPRGRVDWTLDTVTEHAEPHVAKIRDINARRASALLLGSSGTGKTGLAIGAQRDAMEAGRSTEFVLLPLLLVDLNDCYRVENSSRGDLIRHYTDAQSADLLVIDDLGAELRDTEAVRGDVWLIIELRQANDKPMIITTNCDAAELRKRYDDRTFSRLREFERIEVNGDDQRGRKAKQREKG